MADIFGGTQPPAWLQEQSTRNAERGQWGSVLGTLAAGFVNGMKRTESEVPTYDPNTGEQTGTQTVKGPRLGFGNGLFEARMNQQDPMWKIKAQQAQANMLTDIAQLESANVLAQQRKAEASAWLEDAPKLTPWLAASPEKRKDMQAPSVTSQRGVALVERAATADDRYWMVKETNRVREQQGKAELNRLNSISDWNNRVASMPVGELRNTLMGLPMATDYMGKPIGPNSEQIRMYNEWAIKNDKVPYGYSDQEFKDYEARKSNESKVDVAKINAVARTEVAKTSAQAKVETAQITQRGINDRLDKTIAAREKADGLRQQFEMNLVDKKADAQSKLQKELEEIRHTNKVSENAVFMQKPKIYQIPGGGMIIQHGKSIRTINPQNKPDFETMDRIKSANRFIAKLQDDLRLLKPDDDAYQQTKDTLINEQLKVVELYKKARAKTATNADIQALPPQDAEQIVSEMESPEEDDAPAEKSGSKFVFDPSKPFGQRMVPK